jgi:hypothetical protein
VRFLTDTGEGAIERALGEALEIAARTRGAENDREAPAADEFAARWREAVDAAARWTGPR